MDVTTWTAFATWGQFIMMIVTAIIAGIALFTKIRVENLVDLVDEQRRQTIELHSQTTALIEQNEIFRQTLDIELKRYGRESRLNLLNERPWFIMAGQSHHSNTLVQLSLKNKGIEATDISIIDGAQLGANWEARLESEKNAVTEERIVIRVTSTVDLENIHFSIEYQGHDGRRLYQKINKVPGSNFKIEPPEV